MEHPVNGEAGALSLGHGSTDTQGLLVRMNRWIYLETVVNKGKPAACWVLCPEHCGTRRPTPPAVGLLCRVGPPDLCGVWAGGGRGHVERPLLPRRQGDITFTPSRPLTAPAAAWDCSATANAGSGVPRLCTHFGTPGLSPGPGLW